jgi:hypothetical protein
MSALTISRRPVVRRPVAVTAWRAGGAVAAGLLAGCGGSQASANIISIMSPITSPTVRGGGHVRGAPEILPVTPTALCYAEIH